MKHVSTAHQVIECDPDQKRRLSDAVSGDHDAHVATPETAVNRLVENPNISRGGVNPSATAVRAGEKLIFIGPIESSIFAQLSFKHRVRIFIPVPFRFSVNRPVAVTFTAPTSVGTIKSGVPGVDVAVGVRVKVGSGVIDGVLVAIGVGVFTTKLSIGIVLQLP